MSYPTQLLQPLKSTKGISIISLIILAAVVVAVLNAYAYFNPDFQLTKYSIVRLFRARLDEQRVEDLNKIRAAVEQYYEDNNEYPAFDGFCGRIIAVLHPDVNEAIGEYFENRAIPQDPSFRGTNRDYFYRKVDRNSYILMAILEDVPAGSKTYNYERCHDWPGDGVYNYRITGER